jgi:phospholipid transport system substrate-binding protein
MFMSRVRIFAALIAAASVTAPVQAADEPAAAEAENSRIDAAVAFAKALTNGATVALTDETVDEATRLENFRVVLADGLALDTIGRFMLGATRKTMSDEQTARYNEIFPQYITKLYAEQFDEIVGKPLEVVDAKQIGARDVIVRTQFDRKDNAPIMVDWRVRELRSGDRKAIDIIVSGVSIMLVKREEFSSFIETNGVDALLDRLEEEAKS